jgi:Protein of unknown function (DUF4242)
MKVVFAITGFLAFGLLSIRLSAQSTASVAGQKSTVTSSGNKSMPINLYIDVHHLGAGKVKAEDVAKAHAKDLAVQEKYGVHFIKYWVDEAAGTVYCLSSSPDTEAIRNTHAEAHGLLPDQTYLVTEGAAAKISGSNDFYLDIHELGPGKVTAKDVAAAHQKDLAVQKKYGVNFIDYWVNEKNGVVVCLSQAPDSMAVINTHKEAHGLIPVSVEKVKGGE